jgi:tRNA G18 (ribose-2'-O)-methylase SpoU
MMERVSDPDDPRLRPLRDLTDAELRRAFEAAHGLFVVEGLNAIRRALESTYHVRTIVLSEERRRSLGDEPDRWGADVLIVPRRVLSAAAGFDVHRGALAIAERRPDRPLDALLRPARVVLALEGINDHENLGAIARCATAFGVGALLLDPTCADPLYRRSVRVSMGEMLHIAFARVTPWPGVLDEVRAHGFEVLALTPNRHAEALADVAATVAPRRALLLGSEATGLSAAALAAADRQVRIPLREGVDSLNVSHAAAVALHVLGQP